MSGVQARRTDTASRVVNAPPQRVWRALSDGRAWAVWLPPDGMIGGVEWFDFRAGGGFRLVLTHTGPDAPQGKSGGHEDIVEARFIEIINGERIVQEGEFVSDDPAFAGVMRMTWRVTPVATGSEVTIIAENVPPGIRKEDHDEGLAMSLANLAAFVEAG